MKQTTYTSADATLQSAQDKAKMSIGNFETALEHLAGKVENTNERVEHVGEIVKRLKEDFIHLKSTAQNAVQPIMPLVHSGRDLSGKAINRVKAHPSSLFWIAAGIFGAYYLTKKAQSRRPSSQIYQSYRDEDLRRTRSADDADSESLSY